MPIRRNETAFIVTEPGQAAAADVWVVFVAAGDKSGPGGAAAYSGQLPEELAEELRLLGERGLFSGKLGEAELLPTYGRLPHRYVLLAGLGGEPGTLHAWREASGFAARALAARKLGRAALRLAAADPRAGRLSVSDRAHAIAEGLLLGGYSMAAIRKAERPAEGLREVALEADLAGCADAAAERAGIEAALRAAAVYAEATNYARDLTNLPGNRLTPDGLAEEARALAQVHGLSCTVLDEAGIAAHGMGGLAAVGQGSVNPPRMIALRYQGLPEWKEVTGLVGKGITFDTGGISLKKPEGMEEMISDMGGAAVLLGVLHAICALQAPVNVVVVIPAAENMPSGRAFKPGDIVTSMSGHTIEVLNTDAEGRIVLADGVTYALQLGAERLIDVATLTGAVLVALADVATGAVANDDVFMHELVAASRRAGEKLWAFPNYPEYRDMLRSDTADIKNSTSRDRWAGSITGGLFVGYFAGDTPWIHLDTGGTAWLWGERGGLEPKGGTGTMVRTLTEWLCRRLPDSN